MILKVVWHTGDVINVEQSEGFWEAKAKDQIIDHFVNYIYVQWNICVE